MYPAAKAASASTAAASAGRPEDSRTTAANGAVNSRRRKWRTRGARESCASISALVTPDQ